MTKKYFGYELTNGKPFPVIYHQKPTDGHGNETKKLIQEIEFEEDLTLDELALKHPYQEIDNEK